MSVPLQSQKRLLRKELRQKLRALSSEEKKGRSREIASKLFDHPRFEPAKLVLIYVSTDLEVETRSIFEEAWRRGKSVLAPCVDTQVKRICAIQLKAFDGLKSGAFGILEPPMKTKQIRRPEDIDLIIVPGLGFDREGGRLGRGGGFFDRFLAQAGQAFKIGLAFECQRLEKAPRGATDAAVDEVIFG